MSRKNNQVDMTLIVVILVLAAVLAALVYMAVTLTDGEDPIPEETQTPSSSQNTTEPSGTEPSAPATPPATDPTVPVTPDTQAPVITGTRDLEVYAGDAVSYRKGVTVTDDTDKNPQLTVDNSKVLLNTPGVYYVTYTATDAAGNASSVTITVTVRLKPANFVEPEVIYAKADEILAQFIRPDMTEREKAEAIYVWTRRDVHLTYGSAPAGFVHEEADWLQVAYSMLSKEVSKGDCFYFFAVQKLLLQRSGLHTIDCEKIYDGNSHHYWLLVSVDGGKSYYHFDNVWSKSLCLVTDAELDAFSAAISSNPFNRNPNLYPATPTQKLPAGELPWNDPAILAAKP